MTRSSLGDLSSTQSRDWVRRTSTRMKEPTSMTIVERVIPERSPPGWVVRLRRGAEPDRRGCSADHRRRSRCLDTSAGEVGAAPAAAGGGAAAVPVAGGCAAPIADMAAGVPMALPGPLPIAPPVPVVPPVPLGAPLPIAPPFRWVRRCPWRHRCPRRAAGGGRSAGGHGGWLQRQGGSIRPPADGARSPGSR